MTTLGKCQFIIVKTNLQCKRNACSGSQFCTQHKNIVEKKDIKEVKDIKDVKDVKDIPRYGEIKCQTTYASGKECRNSAYFYSSGKYLCEMHSKKDTNRVQLVKFSKTEKEKEQAKHCENIKREGKIELFRIKGMRGSIEYKDGYLCVFPNHKHQNRKDGFGCASISPMNTLNIPINKPSISIPGIETWNITVCKNLENFHQANKVYACELDPKGNITSRFYEKRVEMYNDETPHRRKYTISEEKDQKVLFSIWIDKCGLEKRYSYVESRQFYCNFLERSTCQKDDYKRLKNAVDSKVNIMICGYDAYGVTDNIENDYLDTSKPFGHERVLYTMLKYKENEWPWRKYKTEDF